MARRNRSYPQRHGQWQMTPAGVVWQCACGEQFTERVQHCRRCHAHYRLPQVRLREPRCPRCAESFYGVLE